MGILRKIYTFFIDTIQTFLLAAAFFLVMYVFLFRPFEVSGDSMYPNFLDKEYVLTNVMGFGGFYSTLGWHSKPKLGDVIVFKAPTDTEKDFIKRVIGVPGDKVMVRDGNVFVNNKLLDEGKYLKAAVKTYGGSFLSEGQEIGVPQGLYFVLGDNRQYSSDSREWGFVPEKSIIGESLFIYWPVKEAGFVKNPYK